MSVEEPPTLRDVQDFQFKLHSRLRIFTAQDGTFTGAVNLVAAASKYGLIFVGCPTGIQVIMSSSILELESQSGGAGGEIINYPRREISLPSQPSHLNVNCDQSHLVVAIKRDGCAHALIYSLPSFVAKDIVLVTEVRLSSKPDTSVLELTWNPGITNILAACLSDGSMVAYELKSSGVDISTLPPATQATCFCWSPKGKQLVVGCEAGTLTQYKPDLKAVKTFSPPNLGSGSVSVASVLWLSNYQFAAIYRDKINTDERPGLLIVNAPKTGALSFVNYEDICYSGGDLRPPQYYFIHQPAWSILMMASANSMEVGVMGLQEDQISWEQWTQEDAARAELPLSLNKQETFPVGLGLDTSTQHELPWGDNQRIAPMPVLHILSHQGVLCLFYAVNLRPGAACICTPPEKLQDESGLALFTTVTMRDQSGAPPEVILAASPNFITRDDVPKTPNQPLEFSTPLHSGSAVTSPGDGQGGMRSHLAQDSSTTGASSLKPAPLQTATNFTFTAPAITSSLVTQQISKPATPLVIPQLPSTSIKPQPSFLGSSSASLLQNQEQTVDNSVTVTKIPSASVLSSQSAKTEAPGVLEDKVPTSQMKQVTPPPTAAPAKPAVSQTVNNSVFYNAINDEVVHFGNELAALRSRVNGINVQVGTGEEKRNLCEKADAMDIFWRDLKDTTQAQSSEIRGLKSVLMEAFAWVEEAKSRLQQLNCPMYIHLSRSQSLDPVSARCTASIKQLIYYVENQLRQLNEQLDSQWIDFQDSCRPSVRSKMYIPSLESLYQAMVMQNNILNKQRAIMADIAHRAQEQGRSTQIPLISSAVLARVRDKEDTQLSKGETELSRLAENLVKMKLGPSNVQTIYGMGLNYHRLSRKKELLLREMLSQRTATRVRLAKPSRTTVGGISVGKPIVSKVYTSAVTPSVTSPVTPVSVAVSSKDTSRLSAGVAVTELKQSSPTVNVTKPGSSHSPLFLFGATRSGELDTVSKSFPTRAFSSVGAKSGPASKEIPPGTSMAASSGIFAPTVESSKAKPNVLDSSLSRSRNHISDMASKSNAVGDLSFSSTLHNGKPVASGSFSFAVGLSKAPSVGKLTDSRKKLEDYYEELTPPGTPEYSHGGVPSTGSSVSSSPFTFNFTVTPTTTKAGTVCLSSASEIGSSLQKSPLVSLDSIVAGIGDASSASDTTAKANVDRNSIAASSANNASSGTAFSFGPLSVSQPQQGGTRLGKADEPKEPSDTFRFSQAGISFDFVAAPPSSGTGGIISQASPLKTSATTTDVSLKTPFVTGFGTQNHEGNSAPQANIFGGGESQKLSSSPVASGSTSVSGSSTNILAQSPTSLFGNLSTGSPVKQPASASSETTPVLSKGSTDSTSALVTPSKEAEPQKPESSPKDQSSVMFTAADENHFSQSTSLFGSLSIGSGAPSKPASSESLFGGGSAPVALNLIFGKQPASTESQNVSDVKNAPEATEDADSSKEHLQKSESPSKNTEGSASKPVTTTPGFNQTPAPPDDSSQSSQVTEAQVVPSTSSVFAGAKTENTTAFSFSQLDSSLSGPQTSAVFGQTLPTAQSLTGSIFGALETPQLTVAPVTSAIITSPTTQTTSSASTTFSFALPTSVFGQKSTNIFGQSVSSAAPATSSGSLFGQSICSPTAFGQSEGSIFGQPPATTAGRTNIFGQTSATTTTPSVFGQGNTNTTQSIFGQASSTSLFGQAPSGSSLFGGGFDRKPAFGQSGGSIFGQSGSSGFGTSGGSIFGGGTSVFGGSSPSSAGNVFQSSTGGSIFGGSSPSSASSTGGAFSSGLGQSISQSGFGSPPTFQNKPGGFGGSPVFDRGASGFGSSPTFGGAPIFGGSPTFGSPGKIFGSTSPTASIGFGSTGQQSSTFESLASQSTMTFGNLAQNQSPGFGSSSQSIFGGNQTQQQASVPAFSTGSSSFGGSSFSSWR
ncbi:hypothetical protein B7P43_G04906 [Cryptotermes secundus]|uniref:Nucleoporin Nup159/Nup146 N-terminal domain-containing protein n=1 Tax=Cryptotermes secundus TaxID=105785 RepID=A0A2J7QV61_9NEOP|nr:nuclear pore complex protein Nup214 isoform X2 [Cryptotermes secundus]PNF32473.1 hypothetical protein B7P43_G04906 [Cryptotermes secundus]